jgi:hypothetical protein
MVKCSNEDCALDAKPCDRWGGRSAGIRLCVAVPRSAANKPNPLGLHHSKRQRAGRCLRRRVSTKPHLCAHLDVPPTSPLPSGQLRAPGKNGEIPSRSRRCNWVWPHALHCRTPERVRDGKERPFRYPGARRPSRNGEVV